MYSPLFDECNTLDAIVFNRNELLDNLKRELFLLYLKRWEKRAEEWEKVSKSIAERLKIQGEIL